MKTGNHCIPMLALTGVPSPEKVKARLRLFLETGVDSVMLYPRSGSDIAYMSEDWRALYGEILQYAAENGIGIWLYDEYNWPSGSCQGQVTAANSNYIAKQVALKDGRAVIERVHKDTNDDFINDADVLNPDAVRCFIALTHEKYYAWFHPYFGTVIKGIFTDEPSFQYLREYPYYDGLLEEYQAACGRDLLKDIEAAANGAVPKDFSSVYYGLLSKRFRQSYCAQISAWCKAHNILSTGHFFQDHSVHESILASGDILGCLSELDIPGVDEICTQISSYTDFLFSQIAYMRRRGKPGAMAELFAYGPCNMSYARKKQFIWLAAAYGVSEYFLAISHLDGRGNYRKGGFFHNFSPDSPNFHGMRELVQAAKRASGYADKTPLVSVSVRYPYTATMKALHRPDCAQSYTTLVHNTACALIKNQVQWELIAESDTANTPYTLSFADGKIIEEGTGQVYHSPEACAEWIRARVQTPVQVTDEKGELAPKILLKCYTDGSFLVVDHANEESEARTVFVCRQGQTQAVALPRYGVYASDEALPPVLEPYCTPDAVEYHFPEHNLLRCELFGRQSFSFRAEQELSVLVNSRCYPEKGQVLLDGVPLAQDDSADALTPCLNPFYRQTAVRLSKGEHQISTTCKEIEFFPALILEGDFIAEGNVLSAKKAGRDLPFYGNAAVSFRVKVPNTGKRVFLTVNDTELVTDLSINGKPFGTKAFAPYRFEIPESCFGQETDFTLTFYTSMAPIFGDFVRYSERYTTYPWFLTRTDYDLPRPERLNLSRIRIETER